MMLKCSYVAHRVLIRDQLHSRMVCMTTYKYYQINTIFQIINALENLITSRYLIKLFSSGIRAHQNFRGYSTAF